MFVDNLDELNWMDEESKKKAQEKVGKPQPESPGELLQSRPLAEGPTLVGGKLG